MDKDRLNKAVFDFLTEIIDIIKENNEVTFAVFTDAESSYRHVKSLDAFLALEAIANDQDVRNLLKHGDPDARFESSGDALEWYRTKIWQIIDDYGIDLDLAVR